MCGRYAITTPPKAMRQLFGYREEPDFPPRYNVAPGQPIPVVRLAEGERSFMLARWGLIPSWVKDPRGFSLLINARAETVCEKPAFRNAIRRRRCLIPADGFYEWKREGAAKWPFHIRRRDRAPLAFAGLWETWTGPNGEEMDTAAIVTVPAGRLLAPIHDRRPAILAPEQFAAWLDCARVDAEAALALVVDAPPDAEDALEAYEVSPAVNRAAYDAPDIQTPHVASEVRQTTLF
jgi:putative SOS response-associated peptidase YedK